MGWSAGGHMTNKIITFTDRFKAASSGAGAANWISMYAQSDHSRVPHAVVRRHAVAEERADRHVLEPFAAEGRVEGQDADAFPGRRAGSARADAAVGGDVSRAEVQRRADQAVRRAARGARLDASCGTGCSSARSRWSGSRSGCNNGRPTSWEKVPGEEKKDPADDHRSAVEVARRVRTANAQTARVRAVRHLTAPALLRSRL